MRRKWRGPATMVITVLLAAGAAVQAQAAPGSFADPDDVNLPTDLKTLSHENDDASVTYAVETYDPFEDKHADFKWRIDRTGDQKFDLLVSVEFEGGRLTGKVEDSKEKELGKATVTRTGPHGLRVSFPRKLLGAAEYQYHVMAVSDLNRNEEDDAGEIDVAPDTGFQSHRL